MAQLTQQPGAARGQPRECRPMAERSAGERQNETAKE